MSEQHAIRPRLIGPYEPGEAVMSTMVQIGSELMSVKDALQLGWLCPRILPEAQGIYARDTYWLVATAPDGDNHFKVHKNTWHAAERHYRPRPPQRRN